MVNAIMFYEDSTTEDIGSTVGVSAKRSFDCIKRYFPNNINQLTYIRFTNIVI